MNQVEIWIEHAWRQLQEIVAMRPSLPTPHAVDADITELLHVLSEPGPYLAFSNGDTCPANCLLSDDTLRFLDFEHASFRQALLDVAALRACGCWSPLPEDVDRKAEDAYRKEMAGSCPDILDHASYAHRLTVACAAWTIVRMVRLPKLEQIDEPHPMGFSRRGSSLIPSARLSATRINPTPCGPLPPGLHLSMMSSVCIGRASRQLNRSTRLFNCATFPHDRHGLTRRTSYDTATMAMPIK
jgi:hypothetical protein